MLNGFIRDSIAIKLGFHVFLRVNEICKLRCDDVFFPGDPRLSDFHFNRTGCVVRDAKTRKNQYLAFSDPTLLRLLSRSISSNNNRTEYLFSLLYYALADSFSKALHHLRLGHVGYTVHSLRHGCSTF